MVFAGRVETTVDVDGSTPTTEHAAAYSAKLVQAEAYAGTVGDATVIRFSTSRLAGVEVIGIADAVGVYEVTVEGKVVKVT